MTSVSFIVRSKDRAHTIERAFASIREQTVESEIVVVDSGSTDGTLELARRNADTVIEIRPEEFSYGGALNIGARAASGEIHAALSAHAVLSRPDWLARALAHFADDRVAGACGSYEYPDGTRLLEPYTQTIAEFTPQFGFTNTASTWRASVWREDPFDEHMVACEDKEWAYRVMRKGHSIVFDPFLTVEGSHRRGEGVKALFRREVKEHQELCRYMDVPPVSLRAAVDEWWNDVPESPRGLRVFRRLNYLRAAEIAGEYVGGREARRAGPPPRAPVA